MITILDHRPRQEARVLLLPELPNRDGEPRAALALPNRHPVLFRNLADALNALRSSLEEAHG